MGSVPGYLKLLQKAKGSTSLAFAALLLVFWEKQWASLLLTTKAFVVAEKVWLKKEVLCRVEREWRFTLGHKPDVECDPDHLAFAHCLSQRNLWVGAWMCFVGSRKSLNILAHC